MNLAEIPTDDLMDELERRFDVMFCFGQRQNLRDGENEVVYRRSHGPGAALIGMIEREKMQIILDMLQGAEESGDDE